MEKEEKIRWVGSANCDLLGFQDEPRRDAGFHPGKVQAGLEPDDWKSFDDVRAAEIRIRGGSGIFRVMYVARFEEAVFVFYRFQKKTQATSKLDKDIAEARHRAVANARRNNK